MKNFKKDYLSIDQKITLSKRDCLITPQERESVWIESYTPWQWDLSWHYDMYEIRCGLLARSSEQISIWSGWEPLKDCEDNS